MTRYDFKYSYKGENNVDLSYLNTDGLKELLKEDPSDLYDIIEEEVYDRDALPKQEFSIRKCKCVWFVNMDGPDHYLDQTPIEWECAYSKKPPLSPTILADLFCSRHFSRLYYRLIKAHMDSLVILANMILLLGFLCQIILPKELWFWILYGTFFCLTSLLLPLMHQEILWILVKKFDFLYLSANTAVYCVSLFIIYEEIMHTGVLQFYCFSCSFASLVFHLLDAFPRTIVSHKLQLKLVSGLVLVSGINIVRYVLTPALANYTGGSNKRIHFYGTTWYWNNVHTSSFINLWVFWVRILWVAYYHPGYYTLLRSAVIQKSYKRVSPNANPSRKNSVIEFSKLNTDGLKKILDASPVGLYLAIEKEVERRENILNEAYISEQLVTCVNGCFNNMAGPDHYLDEIPIEWECKYHSQEPLCSSILADIFLPVQYSRAYYNFFKNHVFVLGIIANISILASSISQYVFGYTKGSWNLLNICHLTLIMSFPILHQSILFRLGRKFDFIYLCSLAFFIELVSIFIFEDGLSFKANAISLHWLLHPGVLSLNALDAWPSTILSQKVKILIIGFYMFYCLCSGVSRSITSELQDLPYGSNKQINFFGQSWQLNNIYASINLNYGFYLGRILVQMIYYPGHYNILRSLVKQKSYQRY